MLLDLLPAPLVALVLAPHPDDFDAIAVSLRRLHARGDTLHLAVATAGTGGIDGPASADEKAALREAEQRASCAAFGLPADRVRFLRLWEGGSDDDEPLRALLLALRPGAVFLPHGNDENRTHRRVYDTLRRIAHAERLGLLACLNEDAKTIAMRRDAHTAFDEDEAAWKAGLLRLHASQQARNLAARGTGFDERVLSLNRAAARALGLPAPYAEVFELERMGGS